MAGVLGRRVASSFLSACAQRIESGSQASVPQSLSRSSSSIDTLIVQLRQPTRAAKSRIHLQVADQRQIIRNYAHCSPFKSHILTYELIAAMMPRYISELTVPTEAVWHQRLELTVQVHLGARLARQAWN